MSKTSLSATVTPPQSALSPSGATGMTRSKSMSQLKGEAMPKEVETHIADDENIPDRSSLLFEVSTEVAAKTGGIYTVIKSKCARTVSDWGDRYCLIGIYRESAAAQEFEPFSPPPLFKETFQRLESIRALRVHYGRWLVPGYPRCILLEISNQMMNAPRCKADLWESYHLETPEGENDSEVNEIVVFGYLVYWFFQEFCKMRPDWPIIAQFHEWMAAIGLLLVRRAGLQVGTIFTTHATLLGRYICAGRSDFYNTLHMIDADKEAGSRNIYHRHKIEHVAVHKSHVFTTVSEITGLESKHIHHRAPDFILPNGLNVDRRTLLHEHQNLHEKYREKIHEFVRGHFYGHFTGFDLENTIYLFTAGRFEYYNKGFDMFIESLARLNHILKTDPDNKITCVAFIITKVPNASYNVETLRGASVVRVLRQQVDGMQSRMSERLVDSLLRGEMPKIETVFTQDENVEMKRLIFSMKRKTLPPITTHNVINDHEDPLLCQLRTCRLINHPDDPVKVIYHPDFLTTVSPLLSMEYIDFVRGCDLGIFPSYYEPWGYTPAECMVMGVASICSNLSGFAQHIQKVEPDHDQHGVYIVDRRFRSPEESMQQLVDIMAKFTRLSRIQRIELRNATVALSAILDWTVLGDYYEEARDEAMIRLGLEFGKKFNN